MITFKELAFVSLFSIALGIASFIYALSVRSLGIGMAVFQIAIPFIVPFVFYNKYKRLLTIELTLWKALIEFIFIYLIEGLFFRAGLIQIGASGDWKELAIRMLIFVVISWVVWIIYKKIKKPAPNIG